MNKHLTKLFFVIFLITFNNLSAQTLNVGQVNSYQVGDVICTKIELEEGLPNYAIDTILSRNLVSGELTIIKSRILFKFNPSGKWTSTRNNDTLILQGLSNPYFLRFLSKDSLSIIKDTSNIVISKLEIKDSTFKDGCGKQANYSRYYSFKKNTGDVLQVITVYEGLGAFFQYIQNQSNKIKLIETPQFYISNGQFCGDSSIMKSLRNVSIDIIQDDFIQTWPNPFNTSINTSIIGLYQYKFVDIYGRTLLEGFTDDTIIDTVNLPSGLYHLILKKENQLYLIKVSKR